MRTIKYKTKGYRLKFKMAYIEYAQIVRSAKGYNSDK